jgi:predicted amidohydrolase YtcJ
MQIERAFVNGRVYTLDAERPWGEAVGIADGRIVAVGSSAEVRALSGEMTETVDLERRFLMPGFIDAHLHFLMGARYLSDVGVRDARTMAEVLKRLKEYAEANPDKEWIVGQEFSYGYPDLEGRDFHKSMFDELVPDRPVFFRSGMAHAGWANSKALELAGITRDTPDPENGIVVRDASGEPTGWLMEHATHLMERKLPVLTLEETAAVVQDAIREANRLGITRVQSAGFDDEIFPILGELRDAGDLTLRFTLSTICDPPAFPEGLLSRMITERQSNQDDFLDFRVAKFFLDGVLESHTGYMPDGYADKPEEKGILLWDKQAYIDAVRLAQENGFQVWTHAIGTGAIATALDAYQADQGRSSDLRPRVEHDEIPTEEDIRRFATIGAIASFQPAMIYPKDQWMGMPGIWEKRVGSNKLPLAFPIRSTLDAGVAVAFGTDWPIIDLNPLIGIRNAVLRQSSDHEPAEGWVPAQRITVEEAIHAYTLGAAYAGHREAQEGSIAVGKLADLVVLSANPLETDVDGLHEIAVLRTVVGGRDVYLAD